MSQKSEMILCTNCSEMTMHISNSPNNILHLILTIISASFWFPIWMIILAVQKNPQCTKCGKTSSKTSGGKIFARVMIFVALGLVCLVAVCTAGFISSLSKSESSAPAKQNVTTSPTMSNAKAPNELDMGEFMACAQGDEETCKKVVAAISVLPNDQKIEHLTKLCSKYGSQVACDELQKISEGQTSQVDTANNSEDMDSVQLGE